MIYFNIKLFSLYYSNNKIQQFLVTLNLNKTNPSNY